MASAGGYDHLLKLLLVGDTGVGKSCLVLQFCDGEFPEDMSSTIGVDFKVAMMETETARVKLTIWDTAGQERFRTLTKSYYRGATGVILVYDVTRKETFDGLEQWLAEVDAHSTNADVVKMLVANKIDLDAERQVSRDQGAAFARAHAMLYIETSARTSEGVRDAFSELVTKVLETPSLAAVTSGVAAAPGTTSLAADPDAPPPGTCMGIQC
ncbi:Rab18/RabC-family small GTPase [Thecamonas trahens ATCC 50062]|uniref:Rab18/RabC-family small GTPase n=1 Tax=Thecamonas trahens ATCC 50062 TaxID=461836 RepID=A0A0L0D399_THETB|nr:Rab18/RabC-family small GTPase [Thecamonas trahens ATCC 50062]KNC46646.1 Rab18/RabC-family small GTPase [Thecamonas trahens ATCC 50062]|eukprot:XP_013760419.1 Rab18/RabC-family small GTPase [Thecamonas trahens ATCC 50062]